MKKYLFIILTAALSSACADLLNTAPADQIASGNMWTTEALVDAGMNGLYLNFRDTTPDEDSVFLNPTSGSSGIWRQLWGGLEFQSCCMSNVWVLINEAKETRDYAVSYEWYWCYTGIHRINDAIENLPDAPISKEKYECYMCEAKFLRAWYYARLNQVYQGVPIYLEVVSNEECTKGPSTADEVWEVVLDDLNYCIDNEYFPDNTLGSSDYGRASKGAAYALRGWTYMWLAWENGEDNAYYQLAADDFEKVASCGYGLWAGDYIDFFCEANEKDHEMILPIQFSPDDGFCDYLQVLFAAYDTYDGWGQIRPTGDFVDYYQNADGTKFDWASRIPEWNDAVFLNDPNKREVFFLRDSISVNSSGSVVRDYWDVTESALIQERINIIGLDVFDTYYLKDGNEDRLRTCYNDRDPRLKETILVPYDPYDTANWSYGANGMTQYGKEKRHPHIRGIGDHKDYYVGTNSELTYIYKKFCRHLEGELSHRTRCGEDWPLMRYTDVYLHLAECYVHLGRLGDAVGIVNEIRTRAGMPSVSVGSSDEVMEAVRYERRVELCGEGVDWFDEWRWGTYKDMKFNGRDVYGPTNYWGQWENFLTTWCYADWMYPFGYPFWEREKNPNIPLREGWAF